MNTSEWIEYTGSGRQIEEINASESFLLKRKDGEISFICYPQEGYPIKMMGSY